MLDRYATVSLAALERQKRCKALLPEIVSPVPNKPYPVFSCVLQIKCL
jgi:hypothetical protein